MRCKHCGGYMRTYHDPQPSCICCGRYNVLFKDREVAELIDISAPQSSLQEFITCSNPTAIERYLRIILNQDLLNCEGSLANGSIWGGV